MSDDYLERQPSHPATPDEKLVVAHAGILEWGFTGRDGELARLTDGTRLRVCENQFSKSILVRACIPWIKELGPGTEVIFHQIQHDSMGQLNSFLLPNGQDLRLHLFEGFVFQLVAPALSRGNYGEKQAETARGSR